MTAVLGVVTIIALVAAASILTVGSMACIRSMADRLFKREDVEQALNLEGAVETLHVFSYEEESCQKAREITAKFFRNARRFYLICTIGPLLIISFLSIIKYDIGKDQFIVVNNSISLDFVVYLSQFVYHGFIFVIGLYFTYIVYIMYNITRVAIPFFNSFE